MANTARLDKLRIIQEALRNAELNLRSEDVLPNLRDYYPEQAAFQADLDLLHAWRADLHRLRERVQQRILEERQGGR